MPKHIIPKRKGKGILGLRAGVWGIVGGFLLVCALLFRLAHHQPHASSAGDLAKPDGLIGKQEQPSEDASANAARLRRSPGLPGPSGEPAPRWSNADISNEWATARIRLDELRRNFGDGSAEIQEQTRAVQSLERSASTPGETLDLARARAELARLEVRVGPANETRQAQQQFVESLEESVRANEPADLAQAKAQLRSLRVRFGEQNSEVQVQVQRVAELQR